jgi:hypothetical protein
MRKLFSPVPPFNRTNIFSVIIPHIETNVQFVVEEFPGLPSSKDAPVLSFDRFDVDQLCRHMFILLRIPKSNTAAETGQEPYRINPFHAAGLIYRSASAHLRLYSPSIYLLLSKDQRTKLYRMILMRSIFFATRILFMGSLSSRNCTVSCV